VLATLHRITDKKQYLDGAFGYHDVTRRSHEDAFSNPACGKLAWSSALLYVIAREQRYLDDALCACETMCKAIMTEPPMHLDQLYPDFRMQPPPLTYEVAFEYAYWLSEITREWTTITSSTNWRC